MADPLILTVTPNTTSPFVLSSDVSTPFTITSSSSIPVTLQMGASLTGSFDLTGPSSVRGFEAFIAGNINSDETLMASIAPYTFEVNAANCVAAAITAPLTQIVFAIFRTVATITTQIGTITFNANETDGTVVFTDTAIARRSLVTIKAPSNPDATIADITFLVAE